MEYLKFILAISILYLTATSSLVSCDGLSLKDLGKDIVKTVVVDHNGKADFKTIQAAVNSVPNGNNKWIKIIITPGTYNEKVVIPIEKQKIIMEGKTNVPSQVIIQCNEINVRTWGGPLIVNAEYFVAINITFKNTYNYKRTPTIPLQDIKVAPAVVLLADKVVFSRCRFISVQDTISDMVGRHYFENCYIEGAIDFIWGRGQSIYHSCILYVKGITLAGQIIPGYITAQGRENEQDTSGFVFKRCVIKGNGQTYLGRAYRRYSRVIFYKTLMSNVVVPQGWDSWKQKGHGDKITYVEEKCKGKGANTRGRVKWVKDFVQLKEFNSLIQPQSFIDNDHWMSSLPSHLVSLSL